jgi:Domain of unknown function (DUF4149)
VTALRVLYLLSLAVWIGEIVFFSFVGAPAIFAVLDRAHAGKVTAAIFPRYYAVATAAGLLAVGAGAVLARGASASGLWRAAVAALALGLLATGWAGFVVQPKAHTLRPALETAADDAPVRTEFARLHRVAVALNGASLLAAVLGLGLSAAAFRQ